MGALVIMLESQCLFWQVYTDQDLQLGQRPGHLGGEQERHGGRESHLIREREAAGGQSGASVL